MENIERISKRLERALLSLDQDAAEQIVIESLETETPIAVVENIIGASLERIGIDWEAGRLALSQIYMSGLICEKIVDKILPPQKFMRKNQPVTAIAVFEDYHMLGKRIVYSSLRSAGFEVLDLGGGLSIDRIVQLVKEKNIKILLLSVLMLHSALHIKDLKIRLIDTDVKIIVGGAPFRFDPKLYSEVGADYFGKDSSDAIRIVSDLMGDKL